MSIDAPDDGSSIGEEYTPYEQWVRRLYMTNLFHPVKLGLQNIEHLYKALGRPLENVTVIHVAGSNGKGSVVYKLARTLLLANNNNNRVGMFVSPHIASFRERMQVNFQLIREDQVVELLPRIYDVCRRDDIPVTFFEITTALAFLYFQQEQCNVVVLETGLGGRLDSTNVLPQVALAIITSIGLEHTRILGDTIEKIALEKGGIIKPHCPVLAGPQCPHDVLQACAQEKQASGYYQTDDLCPPLPLDTAETTTKLVDYDLENARIVKAALQLFCPNHVEICKGLTPDLIEQGVSARPSCRFEQVSIKLGDQVVTVILDIAHNPPAMEYLVQKLHTTYNNSNKKNARYRMVVGMSNDKDLRQCCAVVLRAVQGDATRLHLVQAANPRAATLEQILEASGGQLDGAHVNLQPGGDRSVTYQIQRALQALANTKNNNDNGEEEILVICGSVFLMAEAREALGYDEPRDSEYIAQVAGAGFRHGQENFGNSGGVTTLDKGTTTTNSLP